uniref:Uncharacterized protein n=1 Tax=Zea mays TaxID=4577 RepID=C0PLW6_MAIZE|nr:unknown [Zea mays]
MVASSLLGASPLAASMAVLDVGSGRIRGKSHSAAWRGGGGARIAVATGDDCGDAGTDDGMRTSGRWSREGEDREWGCEL